MKGIKNSLSENLSKSKYYNPNTFNATNALMAYLIAIVAFFVFELLVSFIIKKFSPSLAKVDYFFLQIVLTILSQGIILAVALMFFKVKKVSIFKGEGYNFKMNSIDLVMSIMLVLGVSLCFSPLHYDFFDYMTNLFGDLGLTFPEDIIEKSNAFFVAVYALILVPVFPAIIEELLFRGVVMRGMCEKGAVYGILGSSLLFALMHGSVGMIILQFLLGLAIALVVHITKNHVYGCVMHFANNAFLGIILGLPEIANETYFIPKDVVSAFITIFGLVFLIVSAFYFFNKYLAKYKLQVLKKKKEYSPYEKVEKICYSTLSTCTESFTEENFDIDDKNLKENKEVVFLYKNTFISYNKPSNKVVTIILSAVCVVTSIVLLFV